MIFAWMILTALGLHFLPIFAQGIRDYCGYPYLDTENCVFGKKAVKVNSATCGFQCKGCPKPHAPKGKVHVFTDGGCLNFKSVVDWKMDNIERECRRKEILESPRETSWGIDPFTTISVLKWTGGQWEKSKAFLTAAPGDVGIHYVTKTYDNPIIICENTPLIDSYEGKKFGKVRERVEFFDNQQTLTSVNVDYEDEIFA